MYRREEVTAICHKFTKACTLCSLSVREFNLSLLISVGIKLKTFSIMKLMNVCRKTRTSWSCLRNKLSLKESIIMSRTNSYTDFLTLILINLFLVSIFRIRAGPNSLSFHFIY